MALYRDTGVLTKSRDSGFDRIYSADATAPFTGIYRCEGCGHEVVAEEDGMFPMHQRHQHLSTEGAVRYRLIVFAQHQK